LLFSDIASLAALLAGRCAKKQRFGTYSTGAADDRKQATKLAYRMVAQWGMNDGMGAVGYSISEEHSFLGRDITEPREFGEEPARLRIDPRCLPFNLLAVRLSAPMAASLE
jgi:cell division protease FtsH